MFWNLCYAHTGSGGGRYVDRASLQKLGGGTETWRRASFGGKLFCLHDLYEWRSSFHEPSDWQGRGARAHYTGSTSKRQEQSTSYWGAGRGKDSDSLWSCCSYQCGQCARWA